MTITSRERVLRALSFQTSDRIPRDLGGMRSTGISCFAYPKLVAALGLPPRRPRVHDTGQMLALPDLDVLDALGCDVVTIDGQVTNAFEEPEKWHDYDFNGRLAARVNRPDDFKVLPDGTITQGESIMPLSSYVFNWHAGGQPLLAFDAPLPLLDLKKHREEVKTWILTDDQIKNAAALARRVRESTDKAVFHADFLVSNISVGGHAGLGIFPMICLMEPDYVREYHEIRLESDLAKVRALLPEIRENVDIVMSGCDDWGTQNSTISSPEVFRTLYLPYFRRYNDEIHRIAPKIKTFIHTCGAIHGILDMMVEAGFDIINPIQWPAGGKGYKAWKDKLRKKATIWGGGVDSQHTLPLKGVADIKREVADVCRYFKQDGGFVFCNIHNLLAEIPPEKIIAMYRTAGEVV